LNSWRLADDIRILLYYHNTTAVKKRELDQGGLFGNPDLKSPGGRISAKPPALLQLPLENQDMRIRGG